MGACHTNQPVMNYGHLLRSIYRKHAEFDFRIRQIVYRRDFNILFKVDNMIDQRYYYLQQIQIKTNQEIEMILSQIQLSIEMTDGFLLSYYSSFASRKGNCVYIVYEYIELISLRDLLSDKKNQEQRIHINGQVQSQIFSIFYHLNIQQLSIHDLVLENIFVYKKQQKIYIKLIDITLIRKFEYKADTYWKLEKYELNSLKAILKYLNENNIDPIDKSLQFVGINKDLLDREYKISEAMTHYNAYRYNFTKIQNIEMRNEDKANLNYFLFALNKEIRQVLQKQSTRSQREIILNDF